MNISDFFFLFWVISGTKHNQGSNIYSLSKDSKQCKEKPLKKKEGEKGLWDCDLWL